MTGFKLFFGNECASIVWDALHALNLSSNITKPLILTQYIEQVTETTPYWLNLQVWFV